MNLPHWAIQEVGALLDLLDLQVVKEKLVFKDQQALQVVKVYRENRETLDSLAVKDLRVVKATKATKANKETLDSLAVKVAKVFQVNLPH